MADEDVLRRVEELVDQEHRLRQQAAAGQRPTAEEQADLQRLEAALDQCWDLLRRRRAARDAHEDPESLTARPTEEVEGYLQ
ncbi:MAG TPA: DUF2630 family protein [Segeticoccus sp.]|uniref:DUF2630 family protein n=1 Tax=Segeticoccus sp. TaxID=2706531 RepID=UPI002D80FC5F|nr:DUF2630 family protein [Segeticoccus sp.]HET8601101.1 DUF2630 family protein [Segeticoccus sp.]